MHFWTVWQSLSITEKSGRKMGPATGRPMAGRLRGGTPLFNPVHREPMALPLPEFHQFHFVLSLPLLSLLLFLSKFIRNRRIIFMSFASSFAFRVYLLLFARTCLWWYYYPARTILWCIITRKNDFVECYHPQERFL